MPYVDNTKYFKDNNFIEFKVEKREFRKVIKLIEWCHDINGGVWFFKKDDGKWDRVIVYQVSVIEELYNKSLIGDK